MHQISKNSMRDLIGQYSLLSAQRKAKSPLLHSSYSICIPREASRDAHHPAKPVSHITTPWKPSPFQMSAASPGASDDASTTFIAIARTWVVISEDAMIYNDQKGEEFFGAIAEVYSAK